MLPHQDFTPETFTDIYANIVRYITVDEMPLEYRVIFNIVDDVLKINCVTKNFFPVISKDVVRNTLETSLSLFVSDSGYMFKKWFEEKGVDPNFNIPTNIENGSSVLYREVMSVYERCFERAVPSSEALSNLVSYKNAFLSAVSESTVSSQIEILEDKFFVGKVCYKGPSGWLKYCKDVSFEVDRRLDDDLFSSAVHLDEIDKALKLLEKSRSMFKPLGKYGIPELDGATPLLAHRFITICAKEGVGKTLYSCYLVNNLMKENRRILFMCGESPDATIYNNVLSNYIYKKYNKFVSVGQISGSEETSEEANRLINIAVSELTSSKQAILRQSYSYDNLYEELVSDYDNYRMDAVVIDHSAALTSQGKFFGHKEMIDGLAEQVRNFKKEYPVCMIVTSHLSADAIKEFAKTGKVTVSTPTAFSSLLSRESDEVHILLSSPELTKQSLVALQNFKRRGAKVLENPIYLKVLYVAGEWVYDKKYQEGKVEDIALSTAYSQIEQTYLDEDEGYIELDLD